MSASILEVKKLNRRFGGLHAVKDATFTVGEKSITALIGPNGAGKTTLFNLITGTLKPDSGTVLFHKHDITALKPHQVAVKGIARTFQTTKLFPHMTVLENIMLGRHIRSKAGMLGALLNLPSTWKEETKIRQKSRDYLKIFDIAPLAGETAGSLPFGKQRIVEFARAIASEPDLLLLDEPAAGLNMYETAALASLIQKIRSLGITVLIVEHDMSLVMDISDRVIVLNEGATICEGPPNEIQKNPEVITIYLGEDDA